MSNCNSAMRLVATEKGGETPTERIVRMKNDISQWYAEMEQYGLSQQEQKVLEPYYLPANGMPAQQEDLMRILMDENICNFTLAESNDARKICAKKQMDRIEELHQKVMEKAKSEKLGKYVWHTAIKPQMGYSFSLIHSLAYSYIGLQTVYLATYFPSVYWNTACLRVDSGLEEDAATNYGKIAKAVGNINNKGINLSLIDINKSQYMFEPDEENDSILYGMKALNGLNGDTINEIIANRPYDGLQDFINKVKVNKTVMVSLIKSGAFDIFAPREEVMKEYIYSVSEPKKRITLQNYNGLMQKGLLPQEFDFISRVFVFNKMLKANCKVDDVYVLKADNYYNFYEEYYDVDKLEPYGEKLAIKQKEWDKIYKEAMNPAREYFKKNQKDLLDKLNDTLFQEVWDKYAEGSISAWEMASLGMYAHEHELCNVKSNMYQIKEFNYLPEQPDVEYTFSRNGIEIPIFKTDRIMGTVIDKDDNHSSVSILTLNSGVVTVKFNRDYYAKYNRRISEILPDGKKHYIEEGWFKRGTLIVVNGVRRGDLFIAKRYKKTPSHQLYRITKIYDNGSIDMTNVRAGDEEENEI